MSISTTPLPPPARKKRGIGCFGCGCAVLALLAALALGALGTLAYLCNKVVLELSSPTPPAITAFDGGDNLYQKARQKLGDFDHDVQNHQAATIRLSADELNTLVARDPNMIKNHIHVYVTLNDAEGRMQASFPTELPTHGWVKGRYASFDLTFAVHFNTADKAVEMTPRALQLGDKPILGPNAENSAQTQAVLAPYIPLFNQQLNDGIRGNSDGALLLNQAKSIEIQNGQLVIETQ